MADAGWRIQSPMWHRYAQPLTNCGGPPRSAAVAKCAKQAQKLLQLDVRSTHERAPLRSLLKHEGAKLPGAAGGRCGTQRLHFLHDLGRLHRLDDFGVEAFDDGRRRAPGCQNAIPTEILAIVEALVPSRWAHWGRLPRTPWWLQPGARASRRVYAASRRPSNRPSPVRCRRSHPAGQRASIYRRSSSGRAWQRRR